MGLEASCLVPASQAGSCNQAMMTAGRAAVPSCSITPCGTPGGCFVPGKFCTEHRDARSVSTKVADASPFRPLPLGVLPSVGCCSIEGTHVVLEARYGHAEEALRAARRYAADEQLNQALLTYSVALKLDEDNAAICDEFGQFLMANGQLADAECLFNRALALDPLNPAYCYRRGVVLQQRKQPVEAAKAFTDALRHDKGFIGAHFNLGVVHRELGDHRGACEDFRRILALDPNNHCALALLGECQAELGDIEGAVQSLEEALRLDPTNRSAQKDMQRFKAALK